MNIENLKPIPKYILKLIERRDKQYYKTPCGNTRFYAYLTRWNKELVKITVAVKHYHGQFYCKQVAVHGIRSKNFFVKDMIFYYIGGYVVSWYKEGIHKYPKTQYDGQWLEAVYGKKFDPYASVVNLDYVLKIPEYRYSAVYDYKDVDILKYLRCYEQYPQAEYLIKLGLSKFAAKKTILALLAKDKQFRLWIIKNKDNPQLQYNNSATIIRAYQTGETFKESDAFICRKSKLYFEKDYAPIKKQFRGKRLERFFNYIDEQGISYRQYLDYLNACNDLELDMSLNKNAFPHDFKYWHDLRIDECASQQAFIDEKKRIKLFNQFTSIAKKYMPLQTYENADFAVIIAQSPAELVYEGKQLKHCVGKRGYDHKMARGESLIFFVRKLKNIKKPFVTIEYSISSKSILQCYGYNDKKPQKQVLDFVNEQWLPFANNQIKNIKKLKNAA